MLTRILVTISFFAILPMLSASAGTGGKQAHAAKPYLPGHRIYLTHRHGWHRVDYKVSAWVNVPVRDQGTAHLVARNYRLQGWTTQIVQPNKGVFVVKAKLQRWRLATYAAHLRTAESVAGLLRSQGYQARLAY
jgi:hypothetical protein